MDAASRHELDVVLSPSGGEHDRSFERMVSGRRVDGVILMEVRLQDARAARLQRSGLPFVAIGHTADTATGCWVDLDYEGLVARCVHHLADLGHQAIALVNRPQEFLDSGYGPARRALDGFNAAAAARSLAARAFCCPDEATAGEACTQDLLATHPGITGIVTINEAALPGMERELRRSGRACPGNSPSSASWGVIGPRSSSRHSPRPTCPSPTWPNARSACSPSGWPTLAPRPATSCSPGPSPCAQVPPRPHRHESIRKHPSTPNGGQAPRRVPPRRATRSRMPIRW
ncbi:hypothetical protein [Nonomuraea dietziae]|uniref:hypothetical protein n=1 Tax=Nonomuraea dietziae TaxID=65515 RepID=UPI003F4CC930